MTTPAPPVLTISAQLELASKAHDTASATAHRTASAHARADEARDAHGEWTKIRRLAGPGKAAVRPARKPSQPRPAPAAKLAAVPAVRAHEAAEGALSARAYAALTPSRTGWLRSTPAETEAVLRQEPGGADLIRVLHAVQDGPAAMLPRMRTDIGKAVSGDPPPLSPGREKAVRGLLGAIAGSDVSGKHLYRGMQVKGTPDEIMARYSPGTPFSVSLGSYTSDAKVAGEFAWGKRVAGARTGRGQTPVIVRWAEGPKRALPVQNLASVVKVAHEREYLTSGQFEVTGIRQAAGQVTMTVRQVGPLVPPAISLAAPAGAAAGYDADFSTCFAEMREPADRIELAASPPPAAQQPPPVQPVPPPQDSALDSPLFAAAVAAALLTVGPVAAVIAALKVRFALSRAAWTAMSGSLSIAMASPPPLTGTIGPASEQTARQNLARRAQFVVSAAKRLVSDIVAGRAALPEPGPAEAQAAELNVLRGAQFKEAKHKRLQADIARGRVGEVGAWPAFQAGMARERRYYQQHLDAMWNRARAAGMVDMAAQEHGDVLQWNAVLDARTSAECRAADGMVFRASVMPAIGWPGSVHPKCRCYAGPVIGHA